MATITNNVKYMTLMRLKGMYPDLFYPQTWYEAEEFVHVPMALGKFSATHAVDFVYFAIYYDGKQPWRFSKLDLNYVWTKDTDAEGNRVYVGGYGKAEGPDRMQIQIHRHLAKPKVFEPSELSL